MPRKLFAGALVSVALTTTALAQGQSATTAEVTCSPLSDDGARKFITEPGEHLVKGSGVECKAGDMLIQTRFQITDYSATFSSVRGSRLGGIAMIQSRSGLCTRVTPFH
jgi:hypothetical protein